MESGVDEGASDELENGVECGLDDLDPDMYCQGCDKILKERREDFIVDALYRAWHETIDPGDRKYLNKAIQRYVKTKDDGILTFLDNRFLNAEIDSFSKKEKEFFDGILKKHRKRHDEKWMTLEQFNQLSESEYDAKRDQIVRQIELERAGKIPKRLTR
jgi:uncharacterized membrane-anchored protein YjiN (DUF445 family)